MARTTRMTRGTKTRRGVSRDPPSLFYLEKEAEEP